MPINWGTWSAVSTATLSVYPMLNPLEEVLPKEESSGEKLKRWLEAKDNA